MNAKVIKMRTQLFVDFDLLILHDVYLNYFLTLVSFKRFCGVFLLIIPACLNIQFISCS